MQPLSTPPGVILRGSRVPGDSTVLSHEALVFVAELQRRFGPRFAGELSARQARQSRLDRGERLDFAPETRDLREAAWTCAPVPEDILDRRVEITGPVDRKMIINALNSGARVFMADFEDATAPTLHNLVDGQRNLIDAVRREIRLEQNGKLYQLAEQTAALFVRPRGIHLPEAHVRVDDEPARGCLVDFGLYAFHNAAERLRRGLGTYVYLPKLESAAEARVWADVLRASEDLLGLPTGTIRATVLIETLPAAFQMHEILHALRERSAGLNCGRWDYIFSFIKRRQGDPAALLPDRALVTMDRGFLRAYSQLLIQTCHRRGVHAIGGMAAYIPVKHDQARNAEALAKVRADKEREVRDGHDGTWVAHPGLVPIAREVFDAHMPGPNQICRVREDVQVQAADLLAVPYGPRTAEGLRRNIAVGVQYIEAWLRGVGCVPLYDLMEDAATAEISRAQVWQWLKYSATLEDGTALDFPRVREAIDAVLAELRAELGHERYAAGRFAAARALFERLVAAERCEEFLTLPAYEALVADDVTAPAAAQVARVT
ncbi:malate synthase A [Nannocystis exedens]|nr:malate synthase A [Nannocystis exedens]